MQQPTKIIKSFENSELSLWIASKSGGFAAHTTLLYYNAHFRFDLYILNKLLVYRRESTHRFRAALLTKRDERRRIILYFMSKADSM